MKPAWSNRGLLPLLFFAMGLLFSSFSPAAHADSGSLYLSPESVLAMLKNRQEVLFVDVRDREAFDRLKIPGSIHIPLHALKTKTFLKEKTLTLVSEGYPNIAIERTCDALRGAGFTKASILTGGLRSWMLKKGPIEGDPFAAKEVSRVSPKDFFVQKDSPDWLVVAVSGSAAPAFQSLIPTAVPLPWDGSPSNFASALKSVIKNKKGSSQLSILVCDEKGDNYESIERGIQQEELKRVFYLKGGLEAYRVFLEQQALLSQPGKGEVKRCVNCP